MQILNMNWSLLYVTEYCAPIASMSPNFPLCYLTYFHPFRIKAPVIFIPHITPEPPSERRQNAYLGGSCLPLPPRDPEGWVALPKVSINGVLQKQRDVAVELTVRSRCLYSVTPTLTHFLSLVITSGSFIWRIL